jgi:hypothetical protein
MIQNQPDDLLVSFISNQLAKDAPRLHRASSIAKFEMKNRTFLTSFQRPDRLGLFASLAAGIGL